MRKVSYNVAGETFTSYKEAVAFQGQLEAMHDRSFTLETILNEIHDEDTDAKQAHRARINEMTHAGYSMPM